MNFYKVLILLIISSYFASCKSLSHNNTKRYEKLFLDDSLEERFKGKEIAELLNYLEVDYNRNYSHKIDEPPGILRGWRFYFSVNDEYHYCIDIGIKRQKNRINNWEMDEVKKLKIQSMSVVKLPSFEEK